ncbi:MAG: hypothetical protein H0W27_03300 [Actinobacteria bacterium]|nr:hypothetical protein [Actinomycetota bacterium]
MDALAPVVASTLGRLGSVADMVKSFERAPVEFEAAEGQARIVCSNYEGTVRCPMRTCGANPWVLRCSASDRWIATALSSAEPGSSKATKNPSRE